MKAFADPHYVHRAHMVSLTSWWVDGTFVGPTVAAQCSGRIGWDWTRWTHEFVELYRGQDDAEAQRLCDGHNAAQHPLSANLERSPE